MIQEFNVFGEYEIPEVSLCHPNRKKICDLSRIVDFDVKIKFNATSEISLTVLEYADGSYTPFYDEIKQKNKIHINGFGWFIIGDVEEENDGVNKTKVIPAISEESFFNYRSGNFFDGTYKFYDIADNSKTMVGIMLGYMSSWKIGTISSSLWNKYRTFDVTTSTFYSFMMSDISKAYECFFQFDTDNKTLNIFDINDAVTQTNITLSFDNLIKKIKITEKSDEYVSALAVTGGGDLDIRSVNPVGGIFIYDYSYPMQHSMMSNDLITAITVWNEKILDNQEVYADKLSAYKQINIDYITLQSELSDLNAEKKSIEDLIKIWIDSGNPMYGTTYFNNITLNRQLKAVVAKIKAKNTEITNNRNGANIIYSELQAIVLDLSMSNNFTEELYDELQNYTIESSYQNKNIIKTSSMNPVQVQEQSQSLYDQGKDVLSKLSQPRYEFSIDSANFILLKQYIDFTAQLYVGGRIKIELRDGNFFTPVLLEYNFNFYDPTKFSLTFGNRMNLDDALYEFSDLIGNAITAGNSVGVNSPLWNDWSNNYESSVSELLTGSFNATKNNIINSTNQEITIDSVGIRGKTILSDGTYDPRQIWVTGKTIAFTNDDWDNVATAVGEITLPDGSTSYGIAGNVILGNVVASEQLIIQNEKNNFKLDGDGAVLTDASLTVTSTNGMSKIIITPNDGFKLQTNSGGSWVDNIYLDIAGNATFKGKVIATSGTIGGYNISSTKIYSTASDSSGNIISLNSDGTCRIGSLQITKSGSTYSASFSGSLNSTSGTIGGWTLSSTGLTSPYGDYIRSNGTGKLGLLTYNGSTATFAGYVQANNITVGGSNGYVTGGQIGSGTIGGGNIGSHTVTGGNMEAAYATLKADVATLNQVIAGTVTATTIRANQLQANNGFKFGSRYGEWREFDSLSSTARVLCGNLQP